MSLCDQQTKCLLHTKSIKLSLAEKEDIIQCHVVGCNSRFHYRCVSDATSEPDRLEFLNCFACHRCKNYLDTITNIVADQIDRSLTKIEVNISSIISPLLDAFHNNIKPTLVNVGSQTDYVIGHDTNEFIIDLDSNHNTDLHRDTNTYLTPELEPNKDVIFDNLTAPCTNFSHETQGFDKLDKCPLSFNTIRTLPSKSSKEAFLCSIDKDFSLDDITTVLSLENVSCKNTILLNVDGNFKSKKYISLKWKNSVDFYVFEKDFNKSALKGKWFLTYKPPKHHDRSSKFNGSSIVTGRNVSLDQAPIIVKDSDKLTSNRPLDKINGRHNANINQISVKSTQNHNLPHFKNHIPYSENEIRKPLLPTPSVTNSHNNMSSHSSAPVNNQFDNVVSFLEQILQMAKKR